MWSYRQSPPRLENDWLAHFGIFGMKWGVRRYQNPDGTLTEEGKERYRDSDSSGIPYNKDSNGIEYGEAVKKDHLDYLYRNSALTKEGIHVKNDDDRKLLKTVMSDRFGIDTSGMRVHTISGKTMNKMYKLTGQNAYRDDFHILCITGVPFGKELDSFKDSMGCRWFDDVVDNNARRERK